MSAVLKSRIERLEKRLERLNSPSGSTARHLEAVRLRDEERLTYREIGVHFGVGTERARQLVMSGRRAPKYIDRLTMKWEDARSGMVRLAGLSTRVSYILARHGVRSWDQIQAMTDEELLSLPNLGRLALQEIRATAALVGTEA